MTIPDKPTSKNQKYISSPSSFINDAEVKLFMSANIEDSNTITMIINYRGTKETIKLQKIQ